jgi:hypothetical protein
VGGSGAVGSGGAAGASDGGAAGASGLPPLAPCSAPAVSRLKVWEMMTVGGSMMPGSGSPLRTFADGYEMYVVWTLTGGGYGTANTPLKNMGQYANGADPTKNAADISGEAGITLEYATTGNTYMQIRTGAVPHGGDHFKANLPVTAGEIKLVTLKFADFRRPGGSTPPGADVLTDAFSLTFVAGATTTLTLRQIRIGAFVPPCN